MKKAALLFLFAMTAFTVLRAQSDDVIVGGTGDLQYEENVPLAGNRYVNRMLGVQVGHRKHSCLFAEITVSGESRYDDIGFGVHMAYVPGKWGGYGSMGLFDYNGFYTTFGAVLRPVDGLQLLDWQIYGGAAIGWRPGVEIGTRVAFGDTDYSLCSFSFGRMFVDRTSYFTIGLNIDIALAVMLLLF